MKPNDCNRNSTGHDKKGIALLESHLDAGCHTCEGDLEEIRRESADGAVVIHYRCKGECRGGGHAAFDGGFMSRPPKLAGPIFPSSFGRTVAGPEAEHRGRAAP